MQKNEIYRAKEKNVELRILKSLDGNRSAWVSTGFAGMPLQKEEFSTLLKLMIKTKLARKAP